MHRHAGLQNPFHTDIFNHWKSTRALCLSRPLFSLLRRLGHLRSHLPQRHHGGCPPSPPPHQALRFVPYMSERRPGTKPPASWTTPLKTKTRNNLTEQRNGALILLASAGRLKLIRSSRSGLVAPLLQIAQVRVIEEAQLSLQGDQSAS